MWPKILATGRLCGRFLGSLTAEGGEIGFTSPRGFRWHCHKSPQAPSLEQINRPAKKWFRHLLDTTPTARDLGPRHKPIGWFIGLGVCSRTPRLPVTVLQCAWFDEKDYFRVLPPTQGIKARAAAGLRPDNKAYRVASRSRQLYSGVVWKVVPQWASRIGFPVGGFEAKNGGPRRLQDHTTRGSSLRVVWNPPRPSTTALRHYVSLAIKKPPSSFLRINTATRLEKQTNSEGHLSPRIFFAPRLRFRLT